MFSFFVLAFRTALRISNEKAKLTYSARHAAAHRSAQHSHFVARHARHTHTHTKRGRVRLSSRGKIWPDLRYSVSRRALMCPERRFSSLGGVNKSPPHVTL